MTLCHGRSIGTDAKRIISLKKRKSVDDINIYLSLINHVAIDWQSKQIEKRTKVCESLSTAGIEPATCREPSSTCMSMCAHPRGGSNCEATVITN